MFGASAPNLMERFVESAIAALSQRADAKSASSIRKRRTLN
jgi:hypothetical protein